MYLIWNSKRNKNLVHNFSNQPVLFSNVKNLKHYRERSIRLRANIERTIKVFLFSFHRLPMFTIHQIQICHLKFYKSFSRVLNILLFEFIQQGVFYRNDKFLQAFDDFIKNKNHMIDFRWDFNGISRLNITYGKTLRKIHNSQAPFMYSNFE